MQFWLPGRSRVLVRGDSVHVPPGTPVVYRMLGHMSRLLFFSASSGALDALTESRETVERHVYTPAEASAELLPGTREHELARVDAQDVRDDTPPEEEAYFLRSRTGDRRGWPDAHNAFSARGRNTGGRYFSVSTLAAPQPYVIRHFHRLHTENFVCVSGRIWLWVNGQELLLTSGDFLHAPAGTVHSFAIAAHSTRMLGLLTSDVFEPFFDATGVSTDDSVHTEGLIDPSVMMGGIRTNPDLGLVVVDGPPRRVRAAGL
ncbi:cupin domain-containing protein [Nocardiopsis sp. NRRL B-16309]|uniref:cupin domain-containing protein n=1 Tax=Nocardiopsis sp. NRRL B-16309 TaxID=1519494 RepID=UPI000AB3E18E|nr:cupin domain-containing protein [Nocardiopsis sp. NRRL B-16309]